MSVSPGTDAAMEPCGTHAPTMEPRGTHAAAMEAAASKTATTASECIIGNHTCGDKNSCG
jgi:hypothetical protein